MNNKNTNYTKERCSLALSSITNTMQVIQDYNQPIIDNLIQYRLSKNRSPFSL